MVREKIKIIGIDCPTCVYAINKSLLKVIGFIKLEVDVSSGVAIIEYDNSLTNLNKIYEAIREAGYDAEKEIIEFTADFEAEQVKSIEEKILNARGIFDVKASPLSGTIRIALNPHSSEKEKLGEMLESIGIRKKETTKKEGGKEEGKAVLAKKLLAFSLGICVIALSMLGLGSSGGIPLLAIILLASIVQLLSLETLKRGLKSLIVGTPIMDSLIALSSTISFVFGLFFSILEPSPSISPVHPTSFFEASSGVLGFVGLGKYLEGRLRYRAASYLREIERTMEGKARVLRDGSLVEVEAKELKPNDIIEVKNGEKIPADGIVIEGKGYVNESAFTGESLPVFKTSERRDSVLAGTMLVSGYMKIRATRVGKDTSISHIAASAREAQLYKPRFQMMADRIVGRMTWAVIIIALSSFLAWFTYTHNISLSLIFTASVLAVTCPCPLGIAIPMVVSLGISNLARKGVIVRRGDVFERAKNATMVIFDKTGTLTKGKPKVAKFISLSNQNNIDFLSYVCSIEKKSEHILGEAILEFCAAKGIEKADEPSDFENFPGLGIVSRFNEEIFAVGSIELMKKMGAQIEESVYDEVSRIGRNGGTPILVYHNGRVLGIFEIHDELREEAKEIVDFFKKRGLKVGIASGDVEESVKNITEKVGADFFRASLRPEDKADLIREMESKGEKAVFVGDGVNDAVALGASFLGISTSKAADIAKEAGDVVLASDGLNGLKELFIVSNKVLKGAKENLIWAFLYNGVLIPVASGLLYPFFGIILMPHFAALSMVLSDITVILNSFRVLTVG
ncbi:MAG: cation-translocating P-type ATPase [Fervidicoccaceae archaeon]